MKSVLSIQSHVVHGYVGGRAAVFPLQTQGWEVDTVNTVNFSNHTGYGSFSGSTLAPEELESIFTQLLKLGISYQAIITGYIPNANLIQIINQHIIQFKQRNPNLIYLLDPVMGDDNYMYVDKSCIAQYQSILKNNLVDIITPNQFELELLVGYPIDTKSDIITAINQLHKDYKIPYVVITSINGKLFNDKEDIYCIISNMNTKQLKMVKVPLIHSYFTGVGDLFSALLLDKLVKCNMDLLKAVKQVLTIMHRTLKLTHKLALQAAKNDHPKIMNGNGVANGISHENLEDTEELVGKINDAETMKYFELKIIQARQFYDYDGPGEFVEMDVDVI